MLPNVEPRPRHRDFVRVLLSDDHRHLEALFQELVAASRRGDGAEDTFLRAQIAELTSTGQSLMPEGLEKTISKPEMADLVAFLRAAHRSGEGEGADADDRSRPLDIGTLPGLIEPDE